MTQSRISLPLRENPVFLWEGCASGYQRLGASDLLAKKMKKFNITVSTVLWISIAGCTTMSEDLAPINTGDLNEAEFVRSVLGTNPDAKGNYEVVPGNSVTTVRISSPSRPENETALRESMKTMKNVMREKYHSEPNNLRFIFREVTIEE